MKVYFAQVPPGGPIKIGRARDPEKRIAGLRRGASKLPINLLLAVDGGPLTEGWLHHRFWHDRLAGEWFASSLPLIALISTLKRTGSFPGMPICRGDEWRESAANMVNEAHKLSGEVFQIFAASIGQPHADRFIWRHSGPGPRTVWAVVEALKAKGFPHTFEYSVSEAA